MSVRAITYCHATLASLNLTGTQAVVLLTLCHVHKQKGDACFPSLETIAHQSGISRSTAIRAIKALEKAGVIVSHKARDGRLNLPNVYVLFGKFGRGGLRRGSVNSDTTKQTGGSVTHYTTPNHPGGSVNSGTLKGLDTIIGRNGSDFFASLRTKKTQHLPQAASSEFAENSQSQAPPFSQHNPHLRLVANSWKD